MIPRTDHNELFDLLARLSDGPLSDAQQERLNALLLGSAEARRVYRQSMYALALLEKFGGIDSTVEESDGEPIKAPRGTARPFWQRMQSPRATWASWSRPLPLSLSSATVVMLGVLCLLSFVSLVSVETFLTPRPVAIVAHVRGLADVQWRSPRDVCRIGTPLTMGMRLVLTEGVVEVSYESGARVLIEGPAAFSLSGQNSGALEFGKAYAQVPSSAHGFFIQTPHGTVTDLGTEFGVSLTSRKDPADVVVYAGMVEVSPTGHPSQQPVTLQAGDSARLSASGGVELNLPNHPRPQFVRELPDRTPAPQPLVFSYRFNATSTKPLREFDPAWQGDAANWNINYFRPHWYLRNESGKDTTIRRFADHRFPFHIPSNATRITLHFRARSSDRIMEVGLGTGDSNTISVGQCLSGNKRYHMRYLDTRTTSVTPTSGRDHFLSWRLTLDPLANDGHGTAQLHVDGKLQAEIMNLDLKRRGSVVWQTLDCITVRSDSPYVGPTMLALEVSVPE